MNAHNPFDAKQDWTNPYCQNSSNDPMVDALLGNAYHVVRTVYCNLGNLKLIYDFLNQYGMVLGVRSEAELKALTTKAKYARIYGFSRAGDRQVTDYLYVEGDRTGILPDDTTATGSWITVATSGSNGGSTSSGEGAYIPWVYNNGSATGGETSINVPDGTVGVPFIIINGDMQYVGRGFEFNVDSLSVTLAQPLEEGDEAVFLLTGVPAVPDNPNVNDWIQINWLYNNGAAVGGEQVIAIPYTFQSVPAVYKNGLRLYKGLSTESYTADPDNQRIFLTEPLATNDRLIVQLGGEAKVLEVVDHTVQEVARSTNVKDSEVILSTDTTQVLNGKKVVYSVSEQKSYGLPVLPTNVYIQSVDNGKLTYSPGNVIVDLLPVPSQVRDELLAYKADLASDSGASKIGIKISLPEAISRTLQERAEDSVSVKDFGAVPNLTTDSTYAIQAAIDATPSGGALGFYGGPYRFGTVTVDKPITLVGNADLQFECIRIKTSKFRSFLTGTLTAARYDSTCRAFQILAYEDGRDYEDIKVHGARFEGFFYNTDFRGRSYDASESDPANRVVRDTSIMGCTSIQPNDGKDRGHFQHVGVTNAKCIGNSTYGGKNATSYNFINGNGSLVVMGNYDHDNEYGSLEIENNKISYGVVTGNIFHKQLWIDDTSNINVTGNTCTDRIYITAQSNNSENVSVVGNNVPRIYVSKFGQSPTGRHRNLTIRGNHITGKDAPNCILLDDSVDSASIEGNDCYGVSGVRGIAIIRHSGANHTVRHNNLHGTNLLFSGSGGKVYSYDNFDVGVDESPVTNRTDAVHIDNLLRVNDEYLDLPGKYLYKSKYAGEIAQGGSATIELPVSTGGTLSFRGLNLWVLIRNVSTGNFSSYRVDGRQAVFGSSVTVSFGEKYGALGVNTGDITVSNDSSTDSLIRIKISNGHVSQTMQVTIIPEVTSRLGTEE